MGWFKIQRGAGKQWVEGKTFRLAEEVRYMQRRATRQEARIVTHGQLLLFSTKSGDAWLLDASDQLATPLARDGEALSVHIEETETSFAIGWTGVYRIDGAAFVYRDKDSGNVRTILGYPTQRITHEISNMYFENRPELGIGRSLAAPPSHTTVRTGPYTAVQHG